ncbi:MAG: alpha/beta hydrolase [Nocardioides sp.]
MLPTVQARLIATRLPADPEGVVLVLHGGASRRGDMRVSPAQLSVLRMVPITGRIAYAARGRLAVFRLLNSTRGWDTRHTPVDDAAWALDQIGERLGGPMPTSLVGHSLGGRAALLAAQRPEVRSAVALNPWVYATDGQVALHDRTVLIVHGSEDRVAKATTSAEVARGLSRYADVGYVSVTGGKHSMLARHRVFDGLALDFVRSTLLGDQVNGVVGRVLAGESWLEV